MSRTSFEISHAFDHLLHKDRISSSDDVSVVTRVDPKAEAIPSGLPSFQWDMKKVSTSMLPAFQYISRKLSEHDLSIALVISDRDPFVIPVWPLPKRSQLLLAKIVRKACTRFALKSSFLNALATSTRKDLPKTFDTHRADSYIVRRSIVQNDVVFTGEGLTLLNIDHIYTFKQLLHTLSTTDWTSDSREACLSSCVQLLHRINELYTDPKLSKGYLRRVYKDIEFKEQGFDEVHSSHAATYCTASIYDVAMFEPDYTVLSSKGPEDWETMSLSVTELPDTSLTPITRSLTPSPKQVNPIATVDLSTLDTWESDHEADIISPLTVTYPKFRQPSRLPPTTASTTIDPWDFPLPPPPPLLPKSPETWPQRRPAPLRIAHVQKSEETIKPPLKGKIESWDSQVPMSPLRWLESWSTIPPSALCENCHDVLNVPARHCHDELNVSSRRFTLA